MNKMEEGKLYDTSCIQHQRDPHIFQEVGGVWKMIKPKKEELDRFTWSRCHLRTIYNTIPANLISERLRSTVWTGGGKVWEESLIFEMYTHTTVRLEIFSDG